MNKILTYIKTKFNPLCFEYTYNEYVFCTVGMITCVLLLAYMRII